MGSYDRKIQLKPQIERHTMPQDKQKEEKMARINLVEVVKVGQKMILPEGLSYEEDIEVLTRHMHYEREVVDISHVIPTFPWDAALALLRVMEQKFGIVHVDGFPVEGFLPWLKEKGTAQLRSVHVSHDQTETVPWGRLLLPNAPRDGEYNFLETSAVIADNRLMFAVIAKVQRRYEPLIREIFKDTESYLRQHSIYRGKALRLRFRNDDGHFIKDMQPRFMDLGRINPQEIVFSRRLERQIESNILTPITDTVLVRAAGTPLKRGVGLAGRFGVGKTLLAGKVAQAAIENGWTFIYLSRVDELRWGIPFAKEYAPAVIFAEDLDRVTSGERDITMDEVLNLLDGVDAKSADLMFIVTTNDLESVNAAMLRPGRLDVILNVTPPDAEAVERLIRVYARDLLSEDEPLDEVGRMLANEIPAVIREVVERSKLESIARTHRRIGMGELVQADIVQAAYTMQEQQALINRSKEPEPSDQEKAAKVLGTMIGGGLREGLAGLTETVEEPLI